MIKRQKFKNIDEEIEYWEKRRAKEKLHGEKKGILRELKWRPTVTVMKKIKKAMAKVPVAAKKIHVSGTKFHAVSKKFVEGEIKEMSKYETPESYNKRIQNMLGVGYNKGKKKKK